MSSKVEEKYKYTKTHEWVELTGQDTFRMGISDHAQSSLGDITYFELPEVGSSYTHGTVIGFVESVKAVSDIYAPMDFEVIAVNETMTDKPELANSAPYTDGWLVTGKLKNPSKNLSQLESLMDGAAYENYVAKEEG